MGIYNNDSLKEAPKKKTSNTVTPDAPSGRISRSKSSEPVKKTSNTVTPDAPSKNAPREKSIPLPIRMKNIVTPDAPSPATSKKSDASSEGFSKAEIAAGEARRKRNAELVKASPKDYASATKTASKPVVKSSPISSSYGSDEDVARQSSIDENAKFFKDRGAFKSGGMVKSSSASSRGDGIAQRGKTRGKYC
jgi:hypothetical protein